MPEPQPWPLSAAATQVLRQPRVSAGVVLQLALKELVASGAWTLRRDTRRLRTSVVLLRRGTLPVPDRAPLPLLDHQLRCVVLPGSAMPLREAVSALARRHAAGELRDACRADLVARELLEQVPRRWWLDGWRRVSDEDGLVRDLGRRQRELRTALASGGPSADSALRDADPALLLLLGRRQLRAVDRAVGDARRRGVEIVVVMGSGDGSLCGLADISATIDSSVDSGGDAGGDGGGD
ncbi:MAG: hypothetical protein Q8R60_14300 [Mycobacteriales bacterium]|nr:hypothetical protein [Mycobacteriales bacterium]